MQDDTFLNELRDAVRAEAELWRRAAQSGAGRGAASTADRRNAPGEGFEASTQDEAAELTAAIER